MWWGIRGQCTDHATVTAGGRLTIDAGAGGTATFLSPTTGVVLGTATVVPGPNTLTLPAFTADIALAIGA